MTDIRNELQNGVKGDRRGYMMNDYYNVDPVTVKEPGETAKDILDNTDKNIAEIFGVLNELSDNLIGPAGPKDVQPSVQDANMMETLMRQRVQTEGILKLLVRLKERMY